MLHASETWPLTKTNLQRLQRNDRDMIRQICSIKPEDVARVRSSKLLAKLEIENLKLILRERRLRWFGHVERSRGAVRTACDIQIDGRRGAGRPKLNGERQEHLEIRCEICYACAASQVLMWMMPLHLHVNQKSYYNMIADNLQSWYTCTKEFCTGFDISIQRRGHTCI